MEKCKWFNNNKGNGYIEYKKNGKVSIYLFVNGAIKEFELSEIKD